MFALIVQRVQILLGQRHRDGLILRQVQHLHAEQPMRRSSKRSNLDKSAPLQRVHDDSS
jgi:hypothetical protein